MIVVGDSWLNVTYYCRAIALDHGAPMLAVDKIEETPGGAAEIAEHFDCKAASVVGEDDAGAHMIRLVPSLTVVPFRHTCVRHRAITTHQVLRLDAGPTWRLPGAAENDLVRDVRVSEGVVVVVDHSAGVVSPAVLAEAGNRAIVNRECEGVRANVLYYNFKTFDDAYVLAKKVKTKTRCERVIVVGEGAVTDDCEYYSSELWWNLPGDLFIGALGKRLEEGATWNEAIAYALKYKRGNTTLVTGAFDVKDVAWLRAERRKCDRLLVACNDEKAAEVLRILRCVDAVCKYDDLAVLTKELQPVTVLTYPSDIRSS